MERIRQTDELARRLGTSEWVLLSSDDGELSLSAQARSKEALERSVCNRVRLQLIAPGCHSSHEYFEAMSRSVRSDYAVPPFYEEHSVLTLLNNIAQTALAE